MKLALICGTFNPIHNAHLSLVEYIRDKFEFDKILLIPAYKPPFKEISTDFAQHRFKMVCLAAEKFDGVEVSDIEFQSEEKSYTYLTIKKLYEIYNLTKKPCFVIGTDAYVDLPKWFEADKLKELVDFIVFEREIPFSSQLVVDVQNQGFNMIKTDLPFCDISSSEIRKRMVSGQSISELVPLEVERYIKENELYK